MPSSIVCSRLAREKEPVNRAPFESLPLNFELNIVPVFVDSSFAKVKALLGSVGVEVGIMSHDESNRTNIPITMLFNISFLLFGGVAVTILNMPEGIPVSWTVSQRN